MSSLVGLIARMGFLPESIRLRAVEKLCSTRTASSAEQLLRLLETRDAVISEAVLDGVKALGSVAIGPAAQRLQMRTPASQ